MSPTKRVLCVDDDEDTCLMLTTLLDRLNYEAVTVPNVSAALERVAAEHFDLYILDTLLPDGTGLEVCEKIREADERTPVVFYSAAVFNEDKVAGLCSGAQAYVSKPNIDELVETIAGLLGDGR
jgi:two-component system OmpR family response regulator